MSFSNSLKHRAATSEKLRSPDLLVGGASCRTKERHRGEGMGGEGGETRRLGGVFADQIAHEKRKSKRKEGAGKRKPSRTFS